MKDGKIFFALVFIIIVVALFACVVADSDSGDCEFEDCYKSCEEGSLYCYRHQPGSLLYKQESYQKEQRTSRATYSTYGTSSTDRYTSGKSYSGSYGAYHSYDEGYADVYMNEDYDMDRYYKDDDYAMGVDDAIEDEDW